MGDYLAFYPTVLRESLMGTYDLIHANYGLLAPFALTQPRLPVVLSLWGSDLHGRYGWLSRRCARHCEAVVVMSDEMAELLDGDCTVIPHGVDFDRFAPRDPSSARAELNWREDVYHVLFPYPPGRTVKDHPRAHRLVKRANADDRLDQPVTLEVVHDVSHERIATCMCAADALLLTSTAEGSPNSVKEALASNLPIVSTDVGDVRRRLADVEPSTVSDTDDALVDGLVSILRARERSNGREQIRHLSLSNTTEALVDVYAHALDGR